MPEEFTSRERGTRRSQRNKERGLRPTKVTMENIVPHRSVIEQRKCDVEGRRVETNQAWGGRLWRARK